MNIEIPGQDKKCEDIDVKDISPIITVKEKNTINSENFMQDPKIKRISLVAISLCLNLTTCFTIFRSLDLTQSEENITNQLLDLYYKDNPPPPEMIVPRMLLRTISNKFSNENTRKEKIFLKKYNSDVNNGTKIAHNIIEIEGNKANKIENFMLCPICYEHALNMITFTCGHEFCEKCVFDYINNKILNSQVQNFKCPNEKCDVFIKEITIELMLKDHPALKKKYEKFKQNDEIAKNPNKRWCIKPSCEHCVFKDPMLNYGKCVCGQEICFLCGNAWHQNESCVEAMDDVFKEYLKGADFKHCPKCNQIIEKSVGCNVMACPLCSFTFCWICLKEYKIGHFSIFNIKGCPGMDSSNIMKDPSKGRKCWEYVKGIVVFLIKMVYYFIVGLMIYPVLPFIIVFFMLKHHKENNGNMRCDRGNYKQLSSIVIYGIGLGMVGYIVYPFGFIGYYCYICICNPHVAYPSERRIIEGENDIEKEEEEDLIE